MTGNELRQAYLDFFVNKGHKIIPSAPLVPKEDPTTLFTSSGMQPLVPYLLGAPHPEGTRLVDSQKSFRAVDIDEVGDNRHTTFFEMLGNWSLGDYFKQEQLPWVWEFLTSIVGLSPDRLHVTLFEGSSDIPKDEESYQIWKSLGVPDERIHYYDAKKNWWSRSGTPQQMPEGEPGGATSEIFFDFGAHLKLHESSIWKDESCHPNCDCGRFLEIGNCVFMEYKKTASGLEPLPKKNVDFGGGLERILAAKNDDPDVFKTDFFWPIIDQIQKITGQEYSSHSAEMRIITDHLKAATFLIKDGVTPSNKAQGYVLRRLLRRAATKIDSLLKASASSLPDLVNNIIDIYQGTYLSSSDLQSIKAEISTEMSKFAKTLNQGLKILEKQTQIDGKTAFDLFSTYGFPLELTVELAKQKGQEIDQEQFKQEFEKHQDLSRTASRGMFKGGLQDHSETVTKYHTATHLLHASLRQTLGDHVQQMGSNITGERLRFDFTHPQALTADEIKQIEDLINQKIAEDLPVTKTDSTYDDAIKAGALAFFGERYPQRVTVYSIGDFSSEVCGGPHVDHTGLIGPLTIFKQESIGAGRRRLYARLA